MQGSAKAHYDGIKAFSETDQTEDLMAIDDSARLSIDLLRHGTLTVNADVLNADLAAFIEA